MRISPAFAIIFVISTSMPAHTEQSQGSGSPGLTTTLDAYNGFILAEAGRHLKGSVLDVGHLEISIAEGTATPIRANDGSVAGLFVTGTGGWTYTSVVPSERAVIETNKSRIAPGLRTNADSASDHFDKMLVIFSDPLWAKEWDPSAGATGVQEGPAAGAAADCEAILKLVRANFSTPEIDFRLAQARLNRGGRYVYIEFIGGTERMGYMLDEVSARTEGIFGFRTFPTYKARFLETVAGHKIAVPAGKQSLWASYRHADIDIASSDNKRGTIATDLSLHVTGPVDGRVLEFMLANSQDSDSPDWDSKVNRLEVKRVLDADGHDLPFAHRYHRLLVEIPPLQTGEADIKIRVETEGEVFLDWKRHHDDSFFALMGAWWPWPPEWRANEHLSFSLKTRTRAPWRSVASGKEIALKEGHEWIETESRAEQSSFQINVLGGKYVSREEVVDGRKIRVFGYAMASKSVVENMPKLAGALIRFYSGLLGPMPADELDIVEVPEFGFGIAPFGMALMTTEAFKPRYDTNIDSYDPRDQEMNRYFRGVNARLAHEIAHQWFGNKAFPASGEDDWLAESLAEYWAGIAMGTMIGTKKGVEDFPHMLADWRGEATNCETTGPITSVDATGGEQWFRDRYCLLYHRGPLVMHMLRTLIGDARFTAASKTFLERAASGPASTDDFAKAVSDAVQTDFTWFFDDWIRKGGTPDLKVDYQTANGHLAGTVSESGGGGFKRLYVPFVIDVGDHKEVRLVFVDHPQTTFDVPIPTATRDVKVDPGRNNLVRYR